MQFLRRSIISKPLPSLSHNNMSISFYLLLFLVCISFQACHSRTLQLGDIKFQKKFQAPIKGRLGKIALSWDEPAIECMKLSASKAGEERESVRSKRTRYKRRRKQVKRLEELKNDHKKVKGNNGVFSSDYEHARTHPPSHN